MNATHDVHAETNPGYCAVSIAHFVKAYREVSYQDPILALAYIALPLILSDDLSSTFEGCNAQTGLLMWLERNPRITVRLGSRINPSLPICTDAIRYGCFSGILLLNQTGNLVAGPDKLPTEKAANIASGAFKRARLLGRWFGGVGSARAVCEFLGVSI